MKKKPTSRKSETDWKRIDAMEDEDIDLSDNPEVPAELFARGIVRRGLKPVPPKKQVTLRVDSDVVAWYRKLGSGYQTKINALLRAYMEEHQRSKA
ncbi:MAG: BrnA antitoxin family protein [bacterium]